MPEPFDTAPLQALIGSAERTAVGLRDKITNRLLLDFPRPDVPIPSLVFTLNCEDISVGDHPAATFLKTILETICNAFRQILDSIDGIIGGILAAVEKGLAAIFGDVASDLGDLIDKIKDAIQEITLTVTQAVGELITRVIAAIVEGIKEVSQALAAVILALETAIVQVLGAVATVIQAIATAVVAVIQAIGSEVRTVIDFLSDKVKDFFEFLLGVGETVLGTIVAGFKFAIESLVAGAEAGLNAIKTVLENVPKAITLLGAGLLETIGTTVGKPLGTLGTLLFEQIEEAIDKVLKDRNITVEGAMGDIFELIGVPPDVAGRLRGKVTGVVPDAQIITISVVIGLLIAVLPQIVSAVAGPPLEELRQEVSGIIRPALLPPADLIDAFYRGELDRDDVNRDLHQAGFTDEKIEALLAIGRSFLPAPELVRLWLRGIIDEEELDRALLGQRVRPEDLPRIKEAAFFVPGPQDLIRMAVREVFTPAIRERFGLDQDFPPEFEGFAKQVGLSEEWARRFWGAHWELPSVRMGFEMFHRGFIPREDIDLLLKTADVMPFWRENILKIAFRPITRVDVRRFHKLGLIDEEELTRRYRDVGYSPEDALKMTEFTIAFNAPDEPEDSAPLRGLTRSLTLGLMEDGAITPTDATELLEGIGFSPDLAALLVGQRELEVERSERKEQAELITESVKTGEITFEAAQDRLGSLGLEPLELKKGLTRLTRDMAKRPNIPSVKQLEQMADAGIIDDTEYRESLELSGFSRAWSERLVKLRRGG